MTTVRDWQASNSDLPRLERDLLIGHVLELTRAGVITAATRSLRDAELEHLVVGSQRLRDGEPLAYVLGEREFWGLSFEVSKSVLIPRPETELLVELVSEGLPRAKPKAKPEAKPKAEPKAKPNAKPWRILELGTGSGAIAVALAHELGGAASITATDVSSAALAVARRNGQRHGVSVDWRHADWFTGITDRYDIIVSNPPYVGATDPHLEDLQHEPSRALISGADGLADIRRILDAAPGHLQPGGRLLLEHGWDQGDEVRQLFCQHDFQNVSGHQDLAGHHRVTVGSIDMIDTIDTQGAPHS